MSRSIRCTRFSVAWRQMEGFTCLHAFRVWTPRRFPQCAVFGVCPRRSLGSVPTAVSFKAYIDLQYCIAGGERMAWAHIQELNPCGEDAEHDCYFYSGTSTAMSIRPGMFFIMFPSDAHKAGCHNEFPKHYRKVVVKIPVKK